MSASSEKEGAWAREYRQGRAEQVKQQRISNLIAISAVPFLAIEERKQAAKLALDLLIFDGERS